MFVRDAEALEAEGVGVFGVGLEDGDLGHPHPVLLAGADAHGGPVFDEDDRIGGDALLHPPAEEQVVVFPVGGLPKAAVKLPLVRGLGGFEVCPA